MKNAPVIVLCFMLLVVVLRCKNSDSKATNLIHADVIVYGGTSAAVTTAVQVAQMGKSVVIVCPDLHLGGMTSSGLGFTDTGDKSVIGGLARNFYQRIYQYYQKPDTWKWQDEEAYGNVGQGTPAMDGELRTMWIFEPHIAERVFEDMISEKNIQVHRNEWLDRSNGVEIIENQIRSIRMLSGKQYAAKIFVDASYEGDLMAAAGVSYHVGRESNDTYSEEWNGVQVGVLHHRHHFGEMQISPFRVTNDPQSGVLPRISPEHPGTKGQADHRIQAYCFRTCLTTHPDNKVPFSRPEGYDSSQYELLLRIFAAGWRETFHKFDPIPNLKTDVNNHGPFSFDNIGMNYDYPEASYKVRNEIIQEHERYQKGLLFFIANDPRIPEDVQLEMQKWGLAKDEFVDNEHWPHQIYVREARRMVGEFVMTENEILGRNQISRSIGMGSYTMDSHNTQRYITGEGHVQNEGDIGVRPDKPYQIDLGAILPKKTECTNLLVPVAVSSSHIAFGSIRMEPVFMILGQSAGTVACLSISDHAAVQDVSYEELKTHLLKDGQVLVKIEN